MSIKGGINRDKAYVECPLCGRPCEVRLTRTGLPFFQCPDCRIQLFVRAQPGVKRLAQIIKRREMKL